jgi:molybdopterin synthase catalytic subunit
LQHAWPTRPSAIQQTSGLRYTVRAWLEAAPRPGLQPRENLVKSSLTITRDPIDEAALLRQRKTSSGMGAVIYFLGIVRGIEGTEAISAIDYEAFEKMAGHQFNLLFDGMAKRWPIESVRLVHRIGSVAVGEPSLWVEVVAPHRGEAFAACQWLIDEMKRVVPIWKRPVPHEKS